MIKFEKTEVVGWGPAIRGMRNPLNSHHRMDSAFTELASVDILNDEDMVEQMSVEFDALEIGPNDHNLMMSLAKGGPVHAKYRRMIHVYVDITAPLYMLKELDTYRFGVEKNSCSTMHKIHSEEITLDDFSLEYVKLCPAGEEYFKELERLRVKYNETKDKKYWYALIQLLPSSYNQKRTVDISYETLANIYEYRRNHKLDEWREMCKWIESLPYSEIITQPILEQSKKVDVEDIFALIEKVKEDNPYIKTELLSEFEDRLREKVK